MSILFEAWRRTRGERSQWARTLGATSPAPRQPSRPTLLPWLLCGLLVALLAGVGVYAWLVHAQADRQPSRSVLVASRASPPAVEKAGQGPLPAERQANIDDTGTAKSVAPPVMTALKPEAPALARHDDDTLISDHDQARTNAKNSGNKPAQAPVETHTKPVKPVVLSALPAGVREAFPDFTIVAHVWNPDEAMRFVISNGRRIEIGENIVAGVRLLEVTRDGEVVRFRGYRVKLP